MRRPKPLQPRRDIRQDTEADTTHDLPEPALPPDWTAWPPYQRKHPERQIRKRSFVKIAKAHPMPGMNPGDMTRARATLGELWKLGRPVYRSELGALMKYRQRDPGVRIAAYEAGLHRIPGPVEIAVLALLTGFRPPWFREAMGLGALPQP